MSLIIALLCILFLGAVLLLVILNHATVDVDLLFRAYPQVPVAVVMVMSLLAGLVFASFISIRIRVLNRRLRRRVLHLEDELEERRRTSETTPLASGGDPSPPLDYPD